MNCQNQTKNYTSKSVLRTKASIICILEKCQMQQIGQGSRSHTGNCTCRRKCIHGTGGLVWPTGLL